MAKITLNDVSNITGSETAALAALNENNSLIEAAIENTLSRDGTSPNAMNNDFDMNGYDILNAGNIDMESGTVGGVDITELVGIEGPQGPQGVPGNDGTNGTDGVSFIWRGTYSGATAYVTNDAVSDQSSSWIALQSTTGNAPPTLPTTSNAYWQLMAAKGTDGAGTGTVTSVSVVSANGLAGSVATATTTPAITLSTTITGVLKGNGTAISTATAGTDYYNPGGTDVAVADGGTGSSTASGARTNLGLVIGTDVFTQRTITAGAGISVTNGSGTGGNPTIAADLGKETIWVPAGSMTPNTTNGPSRGSVETATNKNMIVTLDFDTTTQEFAQFNIAFPKSWDLGTVTFIPYWSHPSTTTNFGVVWGLDAVAKSDTDAQDVAFGTAQTSTDTGGTTDTLYVAPTSSAITIAGSPAVGDLVNFRIHRDPSNGSDTLAVDARLAGIKVIYTINTLKDD